MDSVEIPFYHPEIKLDVYTDEQMADLFEQHVSLPNEQVLEDLRKGLMEVCPLKK